MKPIAPQLEFDFTERPVPRLVDAATECDRRLDEGLEPSAETCKACPALTFCIKPQSRAERLDRNIRRYPKDGRPTLYDRLEKGMLLTAMRQGEFVGVWEVQSKKTFTAAFLPWTRTPGSSESHVRLGAFNPVGVSDDTAFNCYHQQLGVPTIYEEYSPTWTLPWGGTIEARYGWLPGQVATNPAGYIKSKAAA